MERTQDVNIRHANSELWRRLRLLALERGLPAAKLVDEAIADLLKKHGK